MIKDEVELKRVLKHFFNVANYIYNNIFERKLKDVIYTQQ